jgi:hypothetical protein
MLPNAPWADTSDSKNEPGSYVRSVMLWIWHILYILYSLEVGVFLLFLPWLRIWENNYLLYLYPKIRPVIANPYFKGAVLGLGIVNILIGLQEIASFRKTSRGSFSR